MAAWIYPAFTAAVVVMTGNHYVADVVGGWLAVAIGIAAARAASTVARHRGPKRPARAMSRHEAGRAIVVDLTPAEQGVPRRRRDVSA